MRYCSAHDFRSGFTNFVALALRSYSLGAMVGNKSSTAVGSMPFGSLERGMNAKREPGALQIIETVVTGNFPNFQKKWMDGLAGRVCMS